MLPPIALRMRMLHAIEADHVDDQAAGQETLDLSIAAIFVIWVGALLMGLPMLVLPHFKALDSTISRLLRAFSGGVIMAVALVHIIPEGVNEFNSLMPGFPVGGCAVLFGVLLLILADSLLAACLAPEAHKQHIRSSLAAASDQCGSSGSARNGQAHAHGHSHQCMRSLSAAGWVASSADEAAAGGGVRQYVRAYTMELGCVFHSVIIGIGAGVVTGDRQLLVTLMIALAVHQGLEAAALGSVLAATHFSLAKKVLMMLFYSVTTPIGIVVGITLADSFDFGSDVSRAVQGALNGVSGGMLLYISMQQLIAEEFTREDLLVRPKLLWALCAALLLGAASMCVLGIWA